MAFSWKQQRPQGPSAGGPGAASARVTRCKCCGGTDFVDFSESGDRGCAQCGTVLQENNIVSTVQFSESGGSSNVVGQFVSGDKGRPSGGGGGAGGRGRGRFGHSRDSRETTIQNGKKRIGQVLSQLHLRANLSEPACRLFSLCVNQNYVQGRKTMHIVAACVYIVCRQQHFPIMLIDISDKLAVNVYKLGNTFKKLIQYLNLQTEVPIVDPAMYIKRFADKLDLGNKQQAVCITALKIIGAMKRDFLASGRQPSGVCCAALTLATRVNRIERSKEEIRKAVKVCDATVHRRLLEFEQTPTSQLTVEQLSSLPVDVPFPGVKDDTGGGWGGGGEGTGGDGATDDPVLTGAVQMDPPAYIHNRIRDGHLKMPFRASGSKTPWLEKHPPPSKRRKNSGRIAANGPSASKGKGKGKGKIKGNTKSAARSSKHAALEAVDQDDDGDGDGDDEGRSDDGVDDDRTADSGRTQAPGKGKGKGKARATPRGAAAITAAASGSSSDSDEDAVGAHGTEAGNKKMSRKRQRPASSEQTGERVERPRRATAAAGSGLAATAVGAGGECSEKGATSDGAEETPSSGDGLDDDDDDDYEDSGDSDSDVEQGEEEKEEEEEEDNVALKLGVDANTKEGREALTRHVLRVRETQSGRRMFKSRAKRNKVDEEVYSCLGKMFDEDEVNLDLTRPSWVTQQTNDEEYPAKRDDEFEMPTDGVEGSADFAEGSGNTKERDGSSKEKMTEGTEKAPASVTDDSASHSGVAQTSETSSSAPEERDQGGVGGGQGETAASAVVIDDEDWGLYIRAEEDYQRTKKVWTDKHKEWIEDQEEKSRLLAAEGVPPPIYKKRKKYGALSGKNGGETFAEVLQEEAKKNKSLKINHAALQRVMNTDGSLKHVDDDDDEEMEEIFEDNLAPSMPPPKRSRANNTNNTTRNGDVKPWAPPPPARPAAGASPSSSSSQQARSFAGTSVLPPSTGKNTGRGNTFTKDRDDSFGDSKAARGRPTTGRGSTAGGVSSSSSSSSIRNPSGILGTSAAAPTVASVKEQWVPATPKDGGEAAALEAIAALMGTASAPSASMAAEGALEDAEQGSGAEEMGDDARDDAGRLKPDGSSAEGAAGENGIGRGVQEAVEEEEEEEEEDYDEDEDDYGGGLYGRGMDDDDIDDDPYGEEA